MIRALAPLLAGLAAGCGADLCRRGARAAEDCGQPWTEAERDRCREDLHTCSKEEEARLEAMVDCLEERELAGCVEDPADPATVEALLECAGLADGIPATCARTVYQSGAGR